MAEIRNNTEKVFNRLKELAAPGYQNRFSQPEGSDNTQQQFIINDKNGAFIFNILIQGNRYLISSPNESKKYRLVADNCGTSVARYDSGFDTKTVLGGPRSVPNPCSYRWITE